MGGLYWIHRGLYIDDIWTIETTRFYLLRRFIYEYTITRIPGK